jgi:two-component system CheB/CheR fusion protein
MSEKENTDPRRSQAGNLRREAEKRLQDKETASAQGTAEANTRAVLHELQVHQIELEMQNEELLRARAAAKEASDKYQDLFDFAPIGYLLLDQDGRILEANLAGAALLGLDRSKAVNRRLAWYVAEQSRARFAGFLMGVLQTERKQTSEIELQRHEEPVYVVMEGIRAPDAAANNALRITITDITDRKRAEEALAAAKLIAEQANRAKDHFLAVLSHELRTPLTPVLLAASLLQHRPDLAPEVREMLEMVHRNVEMEVRLIDDLLDVTRFAHGKIELKRRSIDLCAVIWSAVEICKFDIEARGLKFGVDLGPNAPYWVEADAPRLQQVFWNLLRNAIKFTPHGGRVDIRCRPNRSHVVVEVNDSGIGIEPETLPRLFNAFEQLDHAITRQFGGLGLGLSISKTLVEMHGGTIEARSEGKGKGATFRIRLSLSAPISQSEASLPAASPQQVDRPLRVLQVEDHGVTAKIMRLLLTAEGHMVETASDVASALELASQHSFDLLISDLGLPDGSGHDLLRQLRTHGHAFPGIALSGYGQDEDIQRSREAGFAIHLTKPASREAIVDAIATITAGEMRATSADPTAGPQPD